MKKKSSIYTRQFTMMAAVILLSFALLGGVFFGLTYRYTISERQDSLAQDAENIAAMTGSMVQQGIGLRSEYFRLYVASVARVSDAYVILAENTGEIIYCAGHESTQVADLTGEAVPKAVLSAVAAGGGYTGMSNLNGMLGDPHYVAARPITVNLASVGQEA